MDDLPIPLQAETPGQLLDSMVLAAVILRMVFAAFGLVVNFAPGKTECVTAARARLVGAAPPDEPLGTEDTRVAALSLPGGGAIRIAPR